MTVRFKGTELRPVLAEAVANQCRVILVKDHGVYFLAERGERRPDGHDQKEIGRSHHAAAVGDERHDQKHQRKGGEPAPEARRA